MAAGLGGIAVGLALLGCGAAWAEDGGEPVVPAAICLGKERPAFCDWPKVKVMEEEDRMIAGVRERSRRLIFDHLEGAVWVPLVADPVAEPNNRRYCENVMKELRRGPVTLFPPPTARSSEVGFRAVAEMWIKKIPENCKQEKELAYDFLAMKDISPTSVISMRYWLYEKGDNRLVFFTDDDNNIYIYIYKNNNCEHERVSSYEDYTEHSPGHYRDYVSGVLELNGKLFGYEGGIFRFMSHPGYGWPDPISEFYEEKLFDRNHPGSENDQRLFRDMKLDKRVLFLYPLEISLPTIMHSISGVGGMLDMATGSYGVPYGPCAWTFAD